MKHTKLLSILSALILIFQMSACSVIFPDIGYGKLTTTFDNDLDIVENNTYYYQPNDAVYLLEDKFIYTDLDESDNNTWGTPRKLMICDLKTGEITVPITKPMGDINNLYYLNGKLYFTAYANTATDWGFCLFSYDLANNELETIYETPNTSGYPIIPFILSDTLYYFANAKTQTEINNETNYTTNLGYKLHKYDGYADSIISEDIPFKFDFLDSFDNNGVFIQDYESGKYYQIKYDGAIVETNEKTAKKADKTLPETNTEINDLLISGRFGDYYILEDKIPPNENEDEEDACGYKYTINYYLYDTNNKETYELTNATYWYYYI